MRCVRDRANLVTPLLLSDNEPEQGRQAERLLGRHDGTAQLAVIRREHRRLEGTRGKVDSRKPRPEDVKARRSESEKTRRFAFTACIAASRRREPRMATRSIEASERFA